MIKLLTGNTKKYVEFGEMLESLRIRLITSKEKIIEIQDNDFISCIRYKAIEAEKKFGEPVFVDDSGIILEQYDPFPGPMTKNIIESIGIPGLEKLISGGSNRARMICIIGIAINGDFHYWIGEVHGILNFSIPIKNSKMPLSDIFLPNDISSGPLGHRQIALEKLRHDILNIHIKVEVHRSKNISRTCYFESAYQCPFCIEFDGIKNSVFRQLIGEQLNSRTLYEDNNFIIIVPIGQFVVGGLLLLSKEHIPSFAHLASNLYSELEILVNKVKVVIERFFGVPPLIFEHGPADDKSKGKCCVDHAHLNIFPVNVDIHSKLKNRIHLKINNISDLERFKVLPEGYLYVDSVIHGQVVYDAEHVVSQLIRKHITQELGIPERWHWRHYLGIDEMQETMKKLSGVIK